jgi:hypothetical protein
MYPHAIVIIDIFILMLLHYFGFTLRHFVFYQRVTGTDSAQYLADQLSNRGIRRGAVSDRRNV